MYIPTTFFSTQGSCITATATTIEGNGNVLTGSFISGGALWNYIQFINTETSPLSASFSSSFNVLSGSTTQAKLLVVGAGGGGGGTSCYELFNCGKWASGGGGGGGIVYYDNFTISPGSYEISVGTGGKPGTTLSGFVVNERRPVQAQESGSVGRPSYFKNREYPFTPFTSSLIQGNGGGPGGQFITIFSGGPDSQVRQDEIIPGVGGSGGGASRAFNSTIDVNGAESNADGFGGLDNANQGNSGGGCVVGTGGWLENGGAGGGGAGTDGVSVITSTMGNPYATAGGNGKLFNLTGTPTYYAAGGYGFADEITGSAALGAGVYGCGGNGGGIGWFGDGVEPTKGENGTVIIAWKTCSNDYKKYAGYTITTQNPESILEYTSLDNQPQSMKLNGYAQTISIIAQTGSICFPQGSSSIQICEEILNPYTTYPVSMNCGIYSLNTANALYTYIPCGETASVSIKSSDVCSVCAISGTVTGGAFAQTDYGFSNDCGTSSFALSGSIVTDGLTLWNSYNSYNNIGTWNDASGNGNNGIVSASAGILNFNYYGLSLPSTTSFLKYAATTASLVASPSSSWTVQGYYPLWARYSGGSSSTLQQMVGTGNTKTQIFRDGGTFHVRYTTSRDGTIGTQTNYTITATGSVLTNILNTTGGLITLTVDKNTSTVTGYYDNMLIGSASAVISDFGSGSIGGVTFGRGLAYDSLWSGTSGTSNITLYNKVLTPSEINQNYNYFKQFYPLVTSTCP